MLMQLSRLRRNDITARFAPALLAGALFCIGIALSTAVAARDLNQDEALQLRKSGKLMSLDALLDIVRQRYPAARLLEAELESEEGMLIYELEVLTTSGSVREIELDAGNGNVLKDEEED